MGQYTIDDVREQLNGTLDIKDDIMSAINDMGGSVTSDTTFDKYPEAIRNIVAPPQPFYVPNSMKFGYSAFNIFPNNFDFSRVTDGNNLFYRCDDLLSVPYTLDLSKLFSANSMFTYCNLLNFTEQYDTITLNIGGGCSDMFNGYNKDLPNFNLTGRIHNLFSNFMGRKIGEIDWSGSYRNDYEQGLFNWYDMQEGTIEEFKLINTLGTVEDSYAARFLVGKQIIAASKESLLSILDSAIRCGDVHSSVGADRIINFNEFKRVDETGEWSSRIATLTTNGWEIRGIELLDSDPVHLSQEYIEVDISNQPQEIRIDVTGSNESYISYTQTNDDTPGNVIWDDPDYVPPFPPSRGNIWYMNTLYTQYGDFTVVLSEQNLPKCSYTMDYTIITDTGRKKITIRGIYDPKPIDEIQDYDWFVDDGVYSGTIAALSGAKNNIGCEYLIASIDGSQSSGFNYMQIVDNKLHINYNYLGEANLELVEDSTNNIFPYKFVGTSSTGRTITMIPGIGRPRNFADYYGEYNISGMDNDVIKITMQPTGPEWLYTILEYSGGTHSYMSYNNHNIVYIPYKLNGGISDTSAVLTKINNVTKVFAPRNIVLTKQ